MKKILLSVAALAAFGATAQVYTCNDAAEFSNWTSYNNDTDTLEWFVVDLSAGTTALASQGECAISNSWTSAGGGTALTPDNLLVSPAIDLTNSVSVTLDWGCGSPETTASGWYEEYYACYVVTAADLPGIIGGTYPTAIHEGALTAGEVMETQSIDISTQAAGQSAVHIVYRHFNCTDENYIALDDISVTADFASIDETELTASVFPNPANEVLNFSLTAPADVVTIYSLDGKVLVTNTVNALTGAVDVADLANGTYIYEFKTAEGNVTRDTFVKK